MKKKREEGRPHMPPFFWTAVPRDTAALETYIRTSLDGSAALRLPAVGPTVAAREDWSLLMVTIHRRTVINRVLYH